MLFLCVIVSDQYNVDDLCHSICIMFLLGVVVSSLYHADYMLMLYVPGFYPYDAVGQNNIGSCISTMCLLTGK